MSQTNRISGLMLFLIGFVTFGLLVSMDYRRKFEYKLEEAQRIKDSLKASQPFIYLPEAHQEKVRRDLDDIREEGKLRAITTYSSTSYFIYKGNPIGFDYELLERMAEALGVELEIVLAGSVDEVFELLANGKGDLIAEELTVTDYRKLKVDFTDPLFKASQVLVQRKPQGWQQMTSHAISEKLVRDKKDLDGKRVHVHSESVFSERMDEIMDEISGKIQVDTVPSDEEIEDVLRKVSTGEYEYSVAEQHIASINQTYFRNLDVNTKIGKPTSLAWAVRKTSPSLKDWINSWMASKETRIFKKNLYHKYFKDKKRYIKRVQSEAYTLNSKQISPHDDLFKKYAHRADLDWRLLASLVYQESNFDPKVVSWAGAKGLMQLMPNTGRKFGADDLHDPVDNIMAGTLYLNYLKNFWRSIPDTLERTKFAMASYCVGHAHVKDAQVIAKHIGKDPNVWTDNVEVAIKLKTKDKYQNLPGVRHGYCRGYTPVLYVKEIFQRYIHYLNAFGEEIPAGLLESDTSFKVPEAPLVVGHF